MGLPNPDEDPLRYYPSDARRKLGELSRERFCSKASPDDYGLGKNWLGCSDGEMARAAMRKIAEAQDHRAYGRDDEAMVALGDALNYLYFEADHIMEWRGEDD